MPELPEVEHVVRGLRPHVLNEKIVNVTFSEAVKSGKALGKETIIKQIDLEDFRAYVSDSTIELIERRSKYIIFHLLKGRHQKIYCVGHLGMAGAFFVQPSIENIPIPNYKKHWHVQFELSNGQMMIYSDIRRFGELKILDESAFHSFNRNIAPEPFDDNAMDYFLKQCKQKKFMNKPIKQVIMDHSVISGCGNIYACEALHNARILPTHITHTLSTQRKKKLFLAIVDVLNKGIQYGGSSISDYRNVEGESGNMQSKFNVYGLKQCNTCGHSITTLVIATRNTHYCEKCQK
ncbi:bifunctional DNA-formamidopyrimidine glycosylase/DNA-(apurinic or apyrimidinic site) lyase [Macrococcoides caseolyticum]|uniref:bifunctional DNA-formamidopyrimidine glycosylase/DNA-(apurinic or apyrimidinic site) lyase n=1 Tax=Macrococcoides caseolyticum TaxID=69966 RepID=UPI001F172FE7|nr:bifunctional DNA-formamidopyrimidine glycosylase/DNA-(apurinic or apyrimidinic site) lyase [Macrococcus caseolyticus]MCE4956312.1 bifunctional DNA-formamidopyrimidine glycosylase/DNA-(apurinic or apyrimidinic site) lyase [Macrococcus caseolyticus]